MTKVGGFRDVARYHILGLMELFGMRLVESQKRPSPPSVYIGQSSPADAKLWRQGKAVFDQMTCHVTPKKKFSNGPNSPPISHICDVTPSIYGNVMT